MKTHRAVIGLKQISSAAVLVIAAVAVAREVPQEVDAACAMCHPDFNFGMVIGGGEWCDMNQPIGGWACELIFPPNNPWAVRCGYPDNSICPWG